MLWIGSGEFFLMKSSLKLAFSTGLMATLFLPAIMPSAALSEEPKDAKISAETMTKSPVSAQAAKPVDRPFAELDARMVRIEHRLVDDLASGRLRPQQAEQFKRMLDNISELEAQFRAHPAKFTKWRIVRLDNMLDKLADAISRNESDRDTAAVDLVFSRSDFMHRLERATAQGRLTPQEVADLKNRLASIDAKEADLRKSQGRLRYHDKLALCIEFDNLGQRLNRYMGRITVAPPELEKESARIHSRLDEAVKSGKINESRADEFKRKLKDISTSFDSAKKPGAGLNDEQVIVLALEHETLANQVEELFEQTAMAELLITKLNRDIDLRMAVALEEGSLTPLEALELKEDYDEIRSTREKMLQENKLNADSEMALALDVARLEGRLERQLHGPTRLWPGLTVSIANTSHRIQDALKAKRLGEEEAKSLTDELRALNKRKFSYGKGEGSAGSLSDQVLSLTEEFQRISAKLEKSMKDREMEIPSVDALRQAIDGRIADFACSGEISVGNARTAVLALAELNSIKEKYAASESEFSARERFALAYELERLSSNLEEQIHAHEALFPGLETRRAQIEALINEGLSSGRLEKINAELYRQKLAENSRLEKQYRADSIGLTGDKALELISGLEQVFVQVDRAIREKQVLLSDLVSLEAAVEKKIRTGFSSGLLSPARADLLRLRYDAVVSAFNKMRAEDGGLSYGERLAFAYGFERMKANVERSLRHLPMDIPSVEEKRLELEQKLAGLLATGRLPLNEVKQLKGLLDQYRDSSQEKHSSSGGISYPEFVILAIELNKLSHHIDESVRTQAKRLPDIDTMQSELTKSLEEKKAAGKVSAALYKSLKDELDKVSEAEAAFRISDETLNFAETLNLVASLQSIKERIESNSKQELPKKNDSSGKSKAGSKSQSESKSKSKSSENSKEAAAKTKGKK